MFFAMSLCRLFLAAQPVLSDICVQQGVAYQSREGRIGLLSKADRYLMTLNGHLDLPGVFLLCALIYHGLRYIPLPLGF